ncbi:MAG: hypothetical protein GAK30_01100 [Paracidovorax wautersii]|uniref:Uncharacterized protein n=1 Tax=Paracidovorax wautersii TaxID=1177982 RepID=A0A7V8JR15_9BURK|nr:MAG: hypothetical protein GAK30_01100 [Paracidovorax wautersii]
MRFFRLGIYVSLFAVSVDGGLDGTWASAVLATIGFVGSAYEVQRALLKASFK